MNRNQCLLVSLGLMIGACAPARTPEGARVERVSTEFAEGCERLGRVEGAWVARARGPEEGGPSSVDSARRKVAALGGNAILIEVYDRPMYHGRDMRYVTRGEALHCPM